MSTRRFLLSSEAASNNLTHPCLVHPGGHQTIISLGRYLIISGAWLTWPICKIYIWQQLRSQYFSNCFLDINRKERHSLFWRIARRCISTYIIYFYSIINLSWGTSICITLLTKYLWTSRRLQGNSFQGPIPKSLSNLAKLSKLWVPLNFCDCRIVIIVPW